MNSPSRLDLIDSAGNTLEIPYHDFGPPGRRPAAALVAGIHGDELNGVFVLSRLAAFLRGIAEGKQDHQRLLERVVVVPAVNAAGLRARTRAWPEDSIDINRAFPGDPDGGTAQRIAHAVLELTRPARYRVDIHSSNAEFEELPQVRLYEPNDDERASACLFGLPAVIERPVNPTFEATLAHAWRASGEETLVIQAGRAADLQLHHCERLFHSLVAFLQRTGILEGPPLSDADDDLHYFGVNQEIPLVAEYDAMFVSNLEPGRWVQGGEVIGLLYDRFGGRLLDEVKTPVSGLLSGLRRHPLVYQGDLVARLHVRGPAGVSDIVFHAQPQ